MLCWRSRVEGFGLRDPVQWFILFRIIIGQLRGSSWRLWTNLCVSLSCWPCVVAIGLSLGKSFVRGRADRFSRRIGLQRQLPGEPV